MPVFKQAGTDSAHFYASTPVGTDNVSTYTFSVANAAQVGFAIQAWNGVATSTFATKASLNAGSEQHTVVYNPSADQYVIGFEDLPLASADNDYQDTIVQVNVTGCETGGTAPSCDPNVNLIQNGGFEAPVVTNAAKWDIIPSGTAGLSWIVNWFGGSTSFNSVSRPAIANCRDPGPGLEWLERDLDGHAVDRTRL